MGSLFDRRPQPVLMQPVAVHLGLFAGPCDTEARPSLWTASIKRVASSRECPNSLRSTNTT